MANYSGFYKGDKKKPKKEKLEQLARKTQSQPFMAKATFVPPAIIPKGKSKDE